MNHVCFQALAFRMAGFFVYRRAAARYCDGRKSRRPGGRRGASVRVEPGDAFHIGSDAKAMLATIVAQEVERGQLRWDTTIEEVLPDVTVTARPEYRHVTLADLLAHRSGLVALYTLDELAAVPALSDSVGAQRLKFSTWVLQQSPAATPGTTAVYSNAGYVVAATMLERVTGRRYEELLQRRLFAPRGTVGLRVEMPSPSTTAVARPLRPCRPPRGPTGRAGRSPCRRRRRSRTRP
jgi:CubicO group peptidase (beta-lactamase class C family)